ncbi:MAG: SDR family NAD(P)-dependent oxidoreductase [Verrucomicrobiales bacterium]|nr:SDR family NAD(P)-dependent oxidoreductase [Verrucomicrobiales bacterium]
MARNILIIGGNSGVGLSLVKQLSAGGDSVFSASRSDSEISNLPGVQTQSFDVTRKDGLLDLPESLDGMVYCPGTINLKPFARLSDDDFQNELEVNFLGAVRAIRLTLPSLKKAGKASIVLFSTVAVQTGLPYHASISGAKGAVEGLTRSLAAEFSPSIRVNCLALSLTDTPLASNLLGSEEKRKASADRHPLKRIGDPDEVAAAARFLLGADSGFMTGQVLQIDGGISTLKLL